MEQQNSEWGIYFYRRIPSSVFLFIWMRIMLLTFHCIAFWQIQSINWGFFQTQRNIYSVAFISNDGHVTDFTRKGHEEYLYFTSNSSKSTKVTWYAQVICAAFSHWVQFSLCNLECLSISYVIHVKSSWYLRYFSACNRFLEWISIKCAIKECRWTVRG